MEGPRPHLHIVRLQEDAPVPTPILLERQDQVLETQAQFTAPERASIRLVALADALERGK